MTMISYAQNREDVLLDRLFPRGVTGFYIDVGAYDPTYNSVTKHFYDLGWRGVNVEPAEHAFERLSASRTRDVNINSGVSDEEAVLTFYESPPESGWSTFSQEQAESHREAGIPLVERTVPVTTLARICEDHVDGQIDFLTVDVEGHERQVLAGADWKRWQPRVVVVEATLPGTKVPSYESWEGIFLDADYQFATFDGLNRYYVRNEDRELMSGLATPANVLDDFIPYEFAKQIEDLRSQVASPPRELAAALALKDALLAESAAFGQQLAYLQSEYKSLEARYRELDAAYTAASTQAQITRTMLADALGRYEALREELAIARDQALAAHELFENVGQTGIAVARRVTRVSHRFPRSGAVMKRSLRGALNMKRQVRQTLRRG